MSYSSTTPQVLLTLEYPLVLCTAVTLTTYVLSLITDNYSQVDRIWTFMPTVYIAYWAFLPLWPTGIKVFPYVIPYVPQGLDGDLVQKYSPRALMMFGLSVSTQLCTLNQGTN